MHAATFHLVHASLQPLKCGPEKGQAGNEPQRTVAPVIGLRSARTAGAHAADRGHHARVQHTSPADQGYWLVFPRRRLRLPSLRACRVLLSRVMRLRGPADSRRRVPVVRLTRCGRKMCGGKRRRPPVTATEWSLWAQSRAARLRLQSDKVVHGVALPGESQIWQAMSARRDIACKLRIELSDQTVWRPRQTLSLAPRIAWFAFDGGELLCMQATVVNQLLVQQVAACSAWWSARCGICEQIRCFAHQLG